MSRFSPWFALLFVLTVTSCDSPRQPPLLEPETTVPAVQDGRDPAFAGSGVFLLPPISSNQYVRSGPFDVEADPRLEFCRLDVQGAMTVENIEAAECAELVAWFETDVSYDGVTLIQVFPTPGGPATADSQFSVNWNTNPEDAGSAFRGSVLVPTLVLGDGGAISVAYDTAARFDALLYANSSDRLDPDLIVGTTAGQNFPIKFIVEESAGCDGLDCFAYRVTCEADTYQTEHAGVLMPEDWAPECDVTVPGPERTWWLFQERLPAGSPCIPSSLIDGIQFEPCYVWQLAEEVDSGDATAFQLYQEEFAFPATVQFCYNDEADGGVPESLRSLTGVYRYSSLPGGGTEVVLTPESDVNALTTFTCPYDGPLNPSQGPLASLGRFVAPALRLLGVEPRPLFAGDAGTLSTKTVRMSEFQHVVRFQIAPLGTLGALLTGSTQALPVQITTPPHGDPLDGPHAGVPGIEVQYQVVSGDADLSGGVPCTDAGGAVIDGCVLVLTSINDPGTPGDEGGIATATLTLGSSGGTVVIRVSVPADPDAGPLDLTVEAVELEVVFLEPLDDGKAYGLPDERFEPTIFICAIGAVPCDAGSAEAVIPTSAIKLVEESGRKFYQGDWKPRDTNTAVGGTFLAQILVGEATIGYSIPIETTKGGKGERVGAVYYNGVSSSVPLKFTITPAGP